jgi:hypothetical protein
MYKYLQTKDIKTKHVNDGEESGEDEAEEQFANEAIQKEMTRMQSGAGKTSDSEGDMSYSEDDQSEGSKQDDDFFSDEENLKDVNIGSGSEGEFNDDPGSDYGEEMEEP